MRHLYDSRRVATGKLARFHQSPPRPRPRRIGVETLEPRLALATGDPDVDLILRLSNLDGSPLTSLAPDHDFLLHVLSQDVRAVPRGVFAAYLDITWDRSLASVNGSIQYSSLYSNGPSGDTSLPGLIDEAGAFNGIAELGGGAN